MKQSINILWNGWKRLAHTVGDFQARMILTAFYIVLVIPFGAVAKLVGDPLRLRQRRQTSYWETRPIPEPTLIAAGREF